MGDVLKFNADIAAKDDAMPVLGFRKAKRRDRLGRIQKLKQTERAIPNGPGKEPDVDTTVEVELHDPHKALAILANYHGLDATQDDEGRAAIPEPLIVSIRNAYADRK